MNESEKVIQIAHEKGILKAADLKSYGISSKVLTRLVENGQLVRSSRGLYRAADMDYETIYHYYAEVRRRIPNSVICLISALAFHEITTQIPHELWLAIGEKARRPKNEHFTMRIVRFSAQALQEGVEEYPIEGVLVKITNPARTVADCFKYRNKIGLDVAIEALKEGFRDRRFTIDEIWQYAKLCRMSNIMRPYLESIV